MSLTPERTAGTPVGPRQTQRFTFAATAADEVVPGTYLMLFRVDLAWEEGGASRLRTVAASKEIRVEVFGESELLEILAVPSILLLPGFLALTTFALLFKLLPLGRRAPEDFWFGATTPQFWLIAISGSAAAAFLYDRATGQDFLYRYSTAGIGRLWLYSVAAGAAAYLLYLYVRWTVGRGPDAAGRGGGGEGGGEGALREGHAAADAAQDGAA